jgi:hypothetical protein
VAAMQSTVVITCSYFDPYLAVCMKMWERLRGDQKSCSGGQVLVNGSNVYQNIPNNFLKNNPLCAYF